MADLTSSSANYPKGSLFYRRHPINLLMPAVSSLAMLVGIGIILTVLANSEMFASGATWPYLILFAGLALFFVLSYFFMQWVFWYFDIWIVTHEELIDSQLVSFFLHTRAELPLRQVQDITYSISGLLATIFKCGNINVQTASKQGSFKLLSIYQPQAAVEAIGQLVKQATQELYGAHELGYVPPTVRLGEILIGRNLISATDVATALAEQQLSPERIGRILLRKNLITKADLLSALSAQYRIPQVDLTYYEIDPQIIYCLTLEIARKYQIIPIFKTPNGVLEIAVTILSEELTREVKEACGSPVFFVLADEDAIRTLIQKYYPEESPIPPITS